MPAVVALNISFCWPLAEQTAPEEGLPRLRESGFEGIELWPTTLETFGVYRWAAALAASGMRCFQLCPYFDFVHGPELVEKSRKDLLACLDAAEILKCGRLRVFTGPPWGEGVVGASDATEEQWGAAIEGLREFCDLAAQRGVELCLECHEGSLMENSPATLRILNAVARPNLTVNLQIPFPHEDWRISLEQLAPYTTHIHIHNWTDRPGLGELTYLSEGAFDWVPVLERIQMDRPGSSLCLSVEHADHGGRHDPWETARRDGPYLCSLQDRMAHPN